MFVTSGLELNKKTIIENITHNHHGITNAQTEMGMDVIVYILDWVSDMTLMYPYV